MMYTDYTFPWIYEAEERRLSDELERRRVVAERIDQQVESHGVAQRVLRRLRRVSAPGGIL
jgi:hypothetical protein